jgi:hypothetical protein
VTLDILSKQSGYVAEACVVDDLGQPRGHQCGQAERTGPVIEMKSTPSFGREDGMSREEESRV